MKKLLALFLALSLSLAMAVPALAWEEPDTKYPTFEQYLDFYRASANPETKALSVRVDAWIAVHYQEYAAFNAAAYFDANTNGTAANVNKGSWFGWNGSLQTAQLTTSTGHSEHS